MVPTVVLFDIDGTLMLDGGAGRRAFFRAMRHELRCDEVFDGVTFAGMTDPAIVKQALTVLNREPTEGLLERLFHRYVTLLHEELAKQDEGAYTLPGVARLLDQLCVLPHLALGLGTGNVEPGARAKLSHVGLWQRFSFGGFGSDHELRQEVLRVGAERGGAALGQPLDSCRIVVIGDTPRDIEAARGIGAEAIAVATGRYGVEELIASKPDLVLEDLTGDQAFQTIATLA